MNQNIRIILFFFETITLMCVSYSFNTHFIQRYPFVSSEIFGTSIKGFEELFFEDNQDSKSNDGEVNKQNTV